jgi:hypothetical protein
MEAEPEPGVAARAEALSRGPGTGHVIRGPGSPWTRVKASSTTADGPSEQERCRGCWHDVSRLQDGRHGTDA